MLEKKSKTIDVETAKLAAATTQMTTSEDSLQQTNEIMGRLKDGIRTIFERIGCSNDAMSAHLGDQSTVNNVNVLQYLGEIEDKTNELLQQFMLVNMRSESDPESLMNAPTAKQNTVSISPPSVDVEADGASKEPAAQESIFNLTDLRRIAVQNCKSRENERKNPTTEKQNNTNGGDKHSKQRKK